MGRFSTLEIREKDSAGVNFLYRTVPGRCLLQLLIRPGVSKAMGAFLDTKLSRHLVTPFVKTTKLDLSDYPERAYNSFNDFFTRHIREGKRLLICLQTRWWRPATANCLRTPSLLPVSLT